MFLGQRYMKESFSKEGNIFDTCADIMRTITNPEYFALLKV